MNRFLFNQETFRFCLQTDKFSFLVKKTGLFMRPYIESALAF